VLQNHLDNLTCKSLGAVEVDGAEVGDLEDHMEEISRTTWKKEVR
jgi:hypothetical protein